MMMKPLISIIIPAYNIERYIVKSLDSLLRQDFKSYEVIIVNDGSTDNTLSVLSDYERRDPRITVINKKNGGVSTARFEGLRRSKGDYVMFVDGDDWLTDDCLNKVSFVINAYFPDIICFGENTCDVYDNYVQTKLPHRFGLYCKKDIEELLFPLLISRCDGDYFTPSLIEKCFKRELCEKYMLVHKDATIGEDGATVIPCVYYANTMYLMEDCLYYYRYNDTSATKGKKVFNWFYPEIVNRHIEHCIDSNSFDFPEQLNRKIVHDVFNVVVTRFYQDLSYKEKVEDIKNNLCSPYYQYAIQNALFKGSLAHEFMNLSLKYHWYFLIYLYSRFK